MAKKQQETEVTNERVSTKSEEQVLREEALPVSEAEDGGDSRLTAGYRDLSDDEKPDPTTIAQVENLKDE